MAKRGKSHNWGRIGLHSYTWTNPLFKLTVKIGLDIGRIPETNCGPDCHKVECILRTESGLRVISNGVQQLESIRGLLHS